MKIYYTEGPPQVTMGAAGSFRKGVSRDIDDKLAGEILKKKTIVFQEGEAPAAPVQSDPSDPSDPTGQSAANIEEE